MIHFFLEKADTRKLELLRYLEKNISKQALKEDIIKDLDITEFILNKVFEEINLDFEKYELDSCFKLVSSHVGIKLLKNSNSPSSQLETCLIKDSLTFSLMETLFFEEFVSINHYAASHFISYSTVYNKLSDIRSFIEKFDFTVNKKNKLVGNKKNIRLFFTYLFSKVCHQSLVLYPENTRNQSLQLLENLEQHREKPFKESEKIRISHFLNVFLLSLDKKNYKKNEAFYVNQDYLENEQTSLFLLNELDKITSSLSRKQCLYEVDELLAYLVAKDFIQIDGYLDHVIKQNFKVYSFNFINEVKEKFVDLSSFIDRSTYQIELIHFNVLNFVLPFENELKSIDTATVTNGFPSYFQFCNEYINKQKENTEFWQFDRYFFRKYLLVLINGEMNKHINNHIYLYVDFSYGKKYSNVIINVIKRFIGIEIVFQEYVDEQTNIILSDIYFENHRGIRQIIWTASAEAKDWETLIIELEKLRKQVN